MKRPAFQFYPADWRKDAALQSCSISAQGLWINIMCIAHECEPYGYLMVNGKPMTAAQLARLVGLSDKECRRLLAELQESGVSSVDDNGAIYSRRMVRDEDIRNRRAAGGILGAEHGSKGKEFGKLGGNPKKKAEYNEPGKLYAVQRTTGGPIKVGITKHLSQRINGIKKQISEELHLLTAVDVEDMAACEAAVHSSFEGRIEGEWIDAEWGEVEEAIRAANHPPLYPPPSSSSSSSPSGKEEEAPTRKSPSRRKKPETLWPDGFELADELRAYAEQHLPSVDATALFEKFRDQAIAKAWEYADWSRAWQTYVRNCAPGSGHWAEGQYPRRKAGAEPMMFSGEVVKWQ